MNILLTLRNLAMGLAIGILLPLTTNYGVNAVIGSYPVVHDYKKWDAQQHKYTFLSAKKEQEYKQKIYYYETIYYCTSVIIGLAALITGALTNVVFLGIGLIVGGVSCLTMGYITYWNNFNDLLRFVSLLIALVILIFMSYRIASKKH